MSFISIFIVMLRFIFLFCFSKKKIKNKFHFILLEWTSTPCVRLSALSPCARAHTPNTHIAARVRSSALETEAHMTYFRSFSPFHCHFSLIAATLPCTTHAQKKKKKTPFTSHPPPLTATWPPLNPTPLHIHPPSAFSPFSHSTHFFPSIIHNCSKYTHFPLLFFFLLLTILFILQGVGQIFEVVLQYLGLGVHTSCLAKVLTKVIRCQSPMPPHLKLLDLEPSPFGPFFNRWIFFLRWHLQ